MGGHTPRAQQTLPPIATANKCQRNHSSAGGKTKSRLLHSDVGQLCLEQSSQTPPRGQSGFSQASLTEPYSSGDMHPRWMELPPTLTTRQTPTLTQQYPTTMTTTCPPSLVSPSSPFSLLGSQVFCLFPVSPPGAFLLC